MPKEPISTPPTDSATAPRALAAEVVTIGDELCRGEVIDTNSAWLSAELSALGLHVRWRSSVTDDPEDIRDALERAARRAEVVLCSGGLGPTEDDRTVDVVSALVGVEPVEEPAHLDRMLRRFAERGFLATPNNRRQVRVPSGATVYPNPVGLAPGFAVRIGRARVACFPGVPRELKGIFEETVRSELSALVGAGPLTRQRTWRVAGLGESHVDHALKGLLDGVSGATLHYRIAFPETLVTVVVRRYEAQEAEALLDALDGEVRRKLGAHAYGTGEETLAQVVGRQLVARGETLALAESCTGGLAGALVTAVPGSSRWFEGGIVSYANRVKVEQLGVLDETLAAHGAVSSEAVVEMAEGARRRVGATWGVAISGVAGPEGGSPDKPVGTVCLAVSREGLIETKRFVWPGTREQVRLRAVTEALFLLLRCSSAAP